MKTKTTYKETIVLWLLFLPLVIKAQQFDIAIGIITNTPSDSRSVNFFDLNNDGWEDIYVSNGLQGGQADLLYRNTGSGFFSSVNNMDIVLATNPSDGASFADYNNDGHIDGVVSSWYGAEDLLYLNNGNARLEYNANAGIASGSFAETAAFGDYDGDGWLDLYITTSSGGNRNHLYRNLKDGSFQRVTNHVLVNDSKLSRGAIWGDFNNDDILDLFVANESNTTNDLFYGLGGGDFSKQASGSVVLSPKSSITASWGDIDNDCDFDLFVGNARFFQTEKNQLFINQAGAFVPLNNDPVVTTDNCTYGSAFGDYDNDGYLDLAVSNGFCNTNLGNNLYRNNGDGSFTDVSTELGAITPTCSFGIAWGDANNDGFLDLMVANCKNTSSDSEKTNTLWMNRGNDNNWLKVKLIGTKSNTNAFGAKLKAKAIIGGEEVWQIREIRSQSGYAGQNSMIAHFGLGDAEKVDSLIIQWPAGGVQILDELEVNQQLIVEEQMINNVEEQTGIRQINFSIFPNPIPKAESQARVLIDNPGNRKEGQLLLYDSLGRLMSSHTIVLNRGETEESISTLIQGMSSGIYQVVLIWEGKRASRKLVVE